MVCQPVFRSFSVSICASLACSFMHSQFDIVLCTPLVMCTFHGCRMSILHPKIINTVPERSVRHSPMNVAQIECLSS